MGRHKGCVISEEHRRKMSLAKLGRKGELANRYKNGVGIYRNGSFRSGNELICFLRDSKDCKGGIDVHHIDGNRKNNEKGNLLPLCKRHHYIVDPKNGYATKRGRRKNIDKLIEKGIQKTVGGFIYD